MNGESTTVECPGCGHVMRIPPEFANTPGRCGKCGTTVNEQPRTQDFSATAPLIQTIDLSDLDRPRHKPTVPAAKAVAEPFGRALARSMLMGLAGALAGGSVLAIFFTVRRAAGQRITPGILFATADTGLVLGFTVCSLYVLVKHLNWGPFRAALGGLIICTITATLIFIIEAKCVAPPDMGILSEVVMAGLAGGVSGLVLGAKLNSED